MLDIALFISGRINTYEHNLLPNLELLSSKYNIHLFISLNGNKNEYSIEAENKLSKWLKIIEYEEYRIPENFVKNIHPHSRFQIINGEKAPYNVLSCFYNTKKNISNIEKYEKENNIKFDIISAFRADTFFYKRSSLFFIKDNEDDLILHQCNGTSPCYFLNNYNTPMLLIFDFIYGNLKSMKIYGETYDYILRMNTQSGGTYRIEYETSLTDAIFDFYFHESKNPTDLTDYFYKDKIDFIREKMINNIRKIKVYYFDCPYIIDNNRRLNDNVYA